MIDEDDAALFASVAGDARPIVAPSRVQRSKAKPRPTVRSTAAASAAVVVSAGQQKAGDAGFSRPSPWTLVRAGVSRERLRRLRKTPSDHLLDLHGASREQALQRLQTTIALVRQGHGRVIEVIHGRGLHSSGGVPVLRQAVYDWLMHGPYSALLLAAIPKPGSGGGACLLLLRRPRGE